MKQIIITRLMHWKKQWLSLMFWLLFPLLGTICITLIAGTVQDDSKVPIGIVLEEETDASEELVQEIEAAPFIRLNRLSKTDALHALEKQELDSVFVIHEGIEKNIHKDNRNRLITSYRSDLSFAYQPVKEMVVSYVQQETGRTKAAYTIKQLEEEYEAQTDWTIEEIIAKSKAIENDEDLLNTYFSFHESSVGTKQSTQLISVWGLWGILSFLSTLLLFDWVIKEKQSKVILRLSFSRFSIKTYMLQNFFLYCIILFITDLLSIAIIYFMFNEWIHLGNVLVYQLFASAAAFLMAQFFRNTYFYYMVSFAFVLVSAIGSGAVLSFDTIGRLTWFELFNPLAPLISGNYISIWTMLITVFAFLWIIRKDRYHA